MMMMMMMEENEKGVLNCFMLLRIVTSCVCVWCVWEGGGMVL